MDFITLFIDMKNNDLYNVNNYSDNDLFDMLDLTNPTDRELEAKILMNIDKYDKMEDNTYKEFFEDVYKHFFESESESELDLESDSESESELIEGFVGQGQGQGQGQVKEVIKKGSETPLLRTNPIEYGKSRLNPLLKETQKRILQLDSSFRDFENYKSSTDYLINLSEDLHNVVSLRLHTISIPYTWYNVSNIYDANYFLLKGVTPGVKDNYEFKFEIEPGTYNINEIIAAFNASIQTVAVQYPEVNFGTTKVEYNELLANIKLTLDIKNVYTEVQYYLYFNNDDEDEDDNNAFNELKRKNSIAGFTGFGPTEIPTQVAIPTPSGVAVIDENGNQTIEYTNANIQPVNDTYMINTIYSNFQYIKNVSGIIDLDEMYNVYVETYDSNNNVVVNGNNYLTILNYRGPDKYNSAQTILDTVKISFIEESGLYSISTIMEAVNRSLSTHSQLTKNSMLQIYDISHNLIDSLNNVTPFQKRRFQLIFTLSPTAITNEKNMKQIVIFPDETLISKASGISPLWLGSNSCFMFDTNTEYHQPNLIKGDVSPVNTKYNVNSTPKITLQCTRSNYTTNSDNNYEIDIATNEYSMKDLVGVKNDTKAYLESYMNLNFTALNSNYNVIKKYIYPDIFYDIGSNKVRMFFDILTSYDQTDYIMDLSDCFIKDFVTIGNGNIIDISFGDSNEFTGSLVISFPYTIDGTNDKINLTSKSSAGLVTPLDLDIYFPHGTYTRNNLIAITNLKFASINEGFRMGQTQLLYDITNVEWKFVYNIRNQMTVENYNIVLSDSGYTEVKETDYKMDLSGSFMKDIFTISNDVIDISVNDSNEFTGINESLFPLVIDSLNNKIVMINETDVNITIDITFTTGIYYEVDTLVTMVNEQLHSVGYTSGAPVYGEVNMDQTVLSYVSGVWKLIYIMRTHTIWTSLGFMDTTYSSSLVESDIDVWIDPDAKIEIRDVSNNNVFSISPYSNIKGLYDDTNSNEIIIKIPDGNYGIYQLYNIINSLFNQNADTNGTIIYSDFDEFYNEYTVLQININRVYSAKDYDLIFFDDTQPILGCGPTVTNKSYAPATWDVTIGWLLGYRNYSIYYLSPYDATNITNYVISNAYVIDAETEVITLIGDSIVDLYIFKNLYLVVDEFSQNHLNDGLVTGVRRNPNVDRPKYSSRSTRVCNPDGNENASILNSLTGNTLTANQVYAANVISYENQLIQSKKLYSDPPYVKDMFALIPLKLASLSHGAILSENSGTLQDNDRKYFGPVNISKMRIKLLNDHGEVLNLNGANWSFSLVFEYLYDFKVI
jgi:hypothetical protein